VFTPPYVFNISFIITYLPICVSVFQSFSSLRGFRTKVCAEFLLTPRVLRALCMPLFFTWSSK
jgi:hypothetical protein